MLLGNTAYATQRLVPICQLVDGSLTVQPITVVSFVFFCNPSDLFDRSSDKLLDVCCDLPEQWTFRKNDDIPEVDASSRSDFSTKPPLTVCKLKNGGMDTFARSGNTQLVKDFFNIRFRIPELAEVDSALASSSENCLHALAAFRVASEVDSPAVAASNVAFAIEFLDSVAAELIADRKAIAACTCPINS